MRNASSVEMSLENTEIILQYWLHITPTKDQ